MYRFSIYEELKNFKKIDTHEESKEENELIQKKTTINENNFKKLNINQINKEIELKINQEIESEILELMDFKNKKKEELNVNKLTEIKNKKEVNTSNNFLSEERIDQMKRMNAMVKLRIKTQDLNNKLQNPEKNFYTLIEELKIKDERHGFSGVVLNDKVMLTLHTSKEESFIFGVPNQNIKIEEIFNPIKYVNKIHMFNLNEFKEYFEICEPNIMLEHLRYGNNEKYDAAHCSFRALYASLTQSDCLTRVSFDRFYGEKLIKIAQENNFIVNCDNEIKTPAEVIIAQENKVFENDFLNDIKDLENDDNVGLRKDLVINAFLNYEKFFK